MADKASAAMMKAAYNQKMDDMKAQINQTVESLVRKYVPAPVIACVLEYPTFFSTATSSGITTMKETKYGSSKENYIYGQLSFQVSDVCRYITVSREDYDALKKLSDKLAVLKKKQEDFGAEVYDALIALRTEKNVEKELPEAMKYLKFPEVKAVPMPVFTGLREAISKIKD